MPDRTWKAFERRLCRDMGTTRIPVTGERQGADGMTDLFSFQFKLRRSLPVWLWAWMDGITGHAKSHGKIGILVLKRPQQRDTDALVVLRWQDWQDLHGGPRAE
jgi:hypothetical protein